MRLTPFLNTQSRDREGVEHQVSPGDFITMIMIMIMIMIIIKIIIIIIMIIIIINRK